MASPNNDCRKVLGHHPNGRPINIDVEQDPNCQRVLQRPKRFDTPMFENVFPDNHIGKLLRGILVQFLIKQEPRLGWARKSACDDPVLLAYPIESVASHMWGVAALILHITAEPKFQEEQAQFDKCAALSMALLHDVPELITGDITPVDPVSIERKHLMEKDAMDKILTGTSEPVSEQLTAIYERYEDRHCNESKLVKDCDKLDFMITAFLLERQGFTGFSEFYTNTIEKGFQFQIATEMAQTLFDVRNNLADQNRLYNREEDESQTFG